MGRTLEFRFDPFDNYFSLMLADRRREPTAYDRSEDYDFRLHLVRGLRTGKIAGFANDGGDLAEDYERLMECLREKPVAGLYDVPDLDLWDATLDQIITAIYQRFVLGQEPRYPMGEERVLAHRVAEGRLDDKEAEED
jgi:hypothetical protein